MSGPRLVPHPIGTAPPRVSRSDAPPCGDVLGRDELDELEADLVCGVPTRHLSLSEQHPSDKNLWHRSLDPPAIWNLDHTVASLSPKPDGSDARNEEHVA